ncbi:peroxiredoxin-like family protein [Streptomyces sp. CoH27]|uniref:peroxiredoxin-like family protein n=1 Tax=Streptomyces sp. CoH27 TaxID=2875763 RepID=UPI001CD55E40|nr:peroxiredoxin-like family protein [Streptomyces sp. CoH27]
MPTSLVPRRPVPALDVPLVGGGRWVLADQRPDRFSLVVFYRGVHCPMCRAHITELDGLIDEFAAVGVDSVLAVSGDDEGRARRAVEEWGISRVPIGYGLPLTSMREWGLYVSKAIKEGQPNEFSEPGVFIVRPDGTLYAAVQTSMPFLRPHLDEVVETIRWVNEHDYPARGEL